MPPRLRIAVLLLALAAMLGVSAAAATPAHFHLDSSASRCDLCFTAHVPAVQPVTAQFVHGVVLHGHVIVAEPHFGYRPFSGRAAVPRGPPSLQLCA